MIEFELTFDGGLADDGLLEFYDAARALAGFQRSLALTTHLVLNGEIITQAPSAKGFQIFIPPFIEGSWISKAKIAIGTAFLIGSVGKDSPVGQIVTSVYDAVLLNTMGFHVDYDKTLQDLYYSDQKNRPITAEKIDSLCEKIESSVADMHRPIVISKSATRAQVTDCTKERRPIGPILSPITYDYVKQTNKEKEDILIVGYISSYNINTFQGRIYSVDESRPISFELSEEARNKKTIGTLTRSQHINGQNPFSYEALVRLRCRKLVSATGKIKKYLVLSIAPETQTTT